MRLQALFAERDALYRDPTPEAAEAFWGRHGFDGAMALALTHAARLRWLDATDAMLAESAQWLNAHGHGRLMRSGDPPLTPPVRDARRMQAGRAPLAPRVVIR